ncbi:MAG: DsrE family protein [Nitrospirae bacterium]|nr:DsrE family protein [Nitrospirota bacterium]
MRLGILITSTTYAEKILEITKAAVKRGHAVVIFMTDDGIYLVTNNEIANLRHLGNVEMSLCNYSATGRHLDEKEIPEGVINGTQYQNSIMHNECDKVLIF